MDVPLFPTFPVLGGHAVYRTRSAHGNLRGAGRTDGGTQASLTAMTTIFWRRSPFIGRRAGQAYISHVRMAIQHHFCANDLLKKSTRFGGPEFAYEITTVKNIMVGKLSTQRVAAARRSQEARFTFAFYQGNRPEFFCLVSARNTNSDDTKYGEASSTDVGGAAAIEEGGSKEVDVLGQTIFQAPPSPPARAKSRWPSSNSKYMAALMSGVRKTDCGQSAARRPPALHAPRPREISRMLAASQDLRHPPAPGHLGNLHRVSGLHSVGSKTGAPLLARSKPGKGGKAEGTHRRTL